MEQNSGENAEKKGTKGKPRVKGNVKGGIYI